MTRPDVVVMRELLERVKAATGPDREIDLAIWAEFYDGKSKPGKVPLPWLHLHTERQDAAISLFKLVLPGWSYCIHESGFGGGDATIHDSMRQPAPGYDIRFDHSAGPCLALIAATLTALIAQEDRHG